MQACSSHALGFSCNNATLKVVLMVRTQTTNEVIMSFKLTQTVTGLLASLCCSYPEVEDIVWEVAPRASARYYRLGGLEFDFPYVNKLTEAIKAKKVMAFMDEPFCRKPSHYQTEDRVELFVKYLQYIETVI